MGPKIGGLIFRVFSLIFGGDRWCSRCSPGVHLCNGEGPAAKYLFFTDLGWILLLWLLLTSPHYKTIKKHQIQ